MSDRVQVDIYLRFATKEEAAEHERIRAELNSAISDRLDEIRKIRSINKDSKDSDLQAAIDKYEATPAGKATSNKMYDCAEQLDRLEGLLLDRYIEKIQDDIPALLNDMANVLDMAFSNYNTESLLDYLSYTRYKAGLTDKPFNYDKTIKELVNGNIYPQREAFRKCKTKTKEDKAKYNRLLNQHIKKIKTEYLTPEVLAEADKKPPKKPNKRDKADLLTPLKAADTFYTPNSYIASNFMEILKPFYRDNSGQMTFVPTNLEIDITGRSKGYVPVMLSINYEGDITKEGTKTIDYNRARIEGFDTAVLDAVCTILETGQNDIYVSAIDALLRGTDKIQKVSPKREERIALAFRKLGGTRVRLDVTNELKSKYDFAALNLKEGIMDAAMLEYTGLELTTYAGAKTHVIHVKEMPAIYQYSKAKGEITSFPTALLNTPERAEERYTTLKVALLKRITLINKRVMNSNTILFDSLYRAAGLEEIKDKGNRSKERDRLIDMLIYWKEQGYIKGYKPHYEGRAYTGFEIEPHYIKPEKKR